MIYSTSFQNISGWDSYGGVVISRDTTIGKTSNDSLKIVTFATEWGGSYYSIGSQTAGTKILFKVFVKGDETSEGKFVIAQIKEETSGTIQTSVPVKLSATEWKEIWVTRKISSTQECTIHVLGFDASNSNIYVDDITVETYTNPVMTTSGRLIFKDGLLYKVRGINYMNIPIGQANDYSAATEGKQVRYDMEDLKAMGLNCIRFYYNIPTYDRNEYYSMLDECFRNGIDVVLWLWMDTATDYSVATGGANRTSAIDKFATVVTNLKDHPAIVGFAHGNEVNYALGGTPLADLFTLFQATIANAKTIDSTKFYTTAYGETTDLLRYSGLAPAMDVWGINIYRGKSLSTLREDIIRVTQKPVILTEYGFDRYNAGEDESGQASRDLVLGIEAEKFFPYLSGHMVFSWRDEWWKHGTNSTHSTTGNANSNDDRDGLFNEEWFGITEALAVDSAQSSVKKQAYNTIKQYNQGYSFFNPVSSSDHVDRRRLV